MTRSSKIVLTSFLVVCAGLVVGAGAAYLSSASATVGPLPAQGLAFPSDTRFVTGIDLSRLFSSALYKRYGGRPGFPMGGDPVATLEVRTGLHLERDADTLLMAARGGEGSEENLTMVLGRFDATRLQSLFKLSHPGARSTKRGRATVSLWSDTERRDTIALAVLDAHTLMFGAPSLLNETLDHMAAGEMPLRQNAPIVARLERVNPGATLWWVGDATALQRVPSSMGPGGGGVFHLAMVEGVVLSADLDPMLSVDVALDTHDEAAAKSLADVVRGLAALATMQAAQRPELTELATAIQVRTESNHVRIQARLSPELLDALTPKRVGEAPPPATRRR